MAKNSVSLGKHLAKAKDELPHGEFEPMLEALNLGKRSAQGFMKIAKMKITNTINFSLLLGFNDTQIKKLDSLPEKVAKEIIDDSKGKKKKDVNEEIDDALDAEVEETNDEPAVFGDTPVKTKPKKVPKTKAPAPNYEELFIAVSAELEKSDKKIVKLESKIADLEKELNRSEEAFEKLLDNKNLLSKNEQIPKQTELLELMKSKGVTQSELVSVLDIQKATVSKILNGKTQASTINIENLERFKRYVEAA